MDQDPSKPDAAGVDDAAPRTFEMEFDDMVLDASHWLRLHNVEPVQAAMLLCQFNPHSTSLEEALRSTGLLIGDHQFRLLLKEFEDQAQHDPHPRTLLQWLEVARAAGLRYHPWIDALVSARGVAGRTPGKAKEARQDERLRACEDAGLVMPTAPEGRLPDGVGKVASSAGVTRQTFSADVRAALERRAAASREGVTRHRIE